MSRTATSQGRSLVQTRAVTHAQSLQTVHTLLKTSISSFHVRWFLSLAPLDFSLGMERLPSSYRLHMADDICRELLPADAFTPARITLPDSESIDLETSQGSVVGSRATLLKPDRPRGGSDVVP